MHQSCCTESMNTGVHCTLIQPQWGLYSCLAPLLLICELSSVIKIVFRHTRKPLNILKHSINLNLSFVPLFLIPDVTSFINILVLPAFIKPYGIVKLKTVSLEAMFLKRYVDIIAFLEVFFWKDEIVLHGCPALPVSFAWWGKRNHYAFQLMFD